MGPQGSGACTERMPPPEEMAEREIAGIAREILTHGGLAPVGAFSKAEEFVRRRDERLAAVKKSLKDQED